jgi:hypothetical protein
MADAERLKQIKKGVWLARQFRRTGVDSPRARQVSREIMADVTTREWIEAEAALDREEGRL